MEADSEWDRDMVPALDKDLAPDMDTVRDADRVRDMDMDRDKGDRAPVYTGDYSKQEYYWNSRHHSLYLQALK